MIDNYFILQQFSPTFNNKHNHEIETVSWFNGFNGFE